MTVPHPLPEIPWTYLLECSRLLHLQKIFFHRPENPVIKEQIYAVLAGYVWDETNPFVKNHNRLVKTVAKVIDMENERALL